jgi:hypothetical protein
MNDCNELTDLDASLVEGGMTFSVTNWLIGYGLGKGLDWYIRELAGAQMGDFTNLSDLGAP